MSPTSVNVLTFITAALLAGALLMFVNDVVFRYRSQLGERLEELSGKTAGSSTALLFKDLKQLDAQMSKVRSTWKSRLQETVEQSGLRIGLTTLLAVSVGLGAVLAIVAMVASQRWWAGPVALLPGVLAPVLYVRVKRALRMRRLALQLPEAFDAISRAVHAGQTVPAALQIVADSSESPISDEFQRCYEEQNLGMPYHTALRNLARRTGIMEMRILVAALLLQARSGGNLVELLNNLSTMVRKRIKLQQKVRALTGEGRMQAAVLIVLPIVAFVSLLVLSPEYIQTLLDRPWVLAATGAAQLVGAVWVHRIAHFEI